MTNRTNRPHTTLSTPPSDQRFLKETVTDVGSMRRDVPAQLSTFITDSLGVTEAVIVRTTFVLRVTAVTRSFTLTTSGESPQGGSSNPSDSLD
jgi:hypothetical protein